jgi:hypothetical protein
MSQQMHKTVDEMLAQIDLIVRQKGTKSIEYVKAVNEFGKIVNRIIAIS